MNKKIMLIILAIIVIAAAVVLIVKKTKHEPVNPNQTTPTSSVTENKDNESVITVSNVRAGQTISLPITITGTVVGNWFFEGSFPVVMKDSTGNQIGVGLATSSQDWMTTNVIPFSVTLPVTNYKGPGTIVFTKDNPSGEAQFNASYSLSVTFQ